MRQSPSTYVPTRTAGQGGTEPTRPWRVAMYSRRHIDLRRTAAALCPADHHHAPAPRRSAPSRAC